MNIQYSSLFRQPLVPLGSPVCQQLGFRIQDELLATVRQQRGVGRWAGEGLESPAGESGEVQLQNNAGCSQCCGLVDGAEGGSLGALAGR